MVLPTAMAEDGIVRALTDDLSFRVVTVSTTSAVRGIIAAQRAAGELAAALGELVTGTLMVRETMAPDYRVQGIVRTTVQGTRLVADSHPSGDLRGLVERGPDSNSFVLGAGVTLQIMRTLANGSLQQGVVEFPPGGGFSDALMAYMQNSEQVTSVLGVSTVLDGDQVLGAGGYMVQLLPDAKQSSLRTMIDRLEGFGSLEKRLLQPGFSAGKLIEELLSEVPYTLVGSDDVRYHCWCDEVRVMSALATLKRPDLEELLSAGEPLGLSCDYCGREYQIQPSQLRGLLKES